LSDLAAHVGEVRKMTLDDMAENLPNRLHDALLRAISVDYSSLLAVLVLDLWVGSLEATSPEEREDRRRGEITLSGVKFFVVEPPRLRAGAGPMMIDIGPLSTLDRLRDVGLPPVSAGNFANWIFVNDTNSFIYLAAADARLRWLE
jgi:hypothetical protein